MSTRNLNRRAILAGAATAVAVVQPGAVRIANAKPVALTVGGGMPSSAEQRLFKIEQEVRNLALKIEATGDAWSAAEHAAFDWKKQNPEPVMPPDLPGLPIDWRKRAIEVINGNGTGGDAIRAIVGVITPERAKQEAEHAQAMTQWEKQRVAALHVIGYYKAKGAFENAIQDHDALCEEAANIRPVTLNGIHRKARLARARNPDHDSMSTDLADSLVDDLLAMQGVQS